MARRTPKKIRKPVEKEVKPRNRFTGKAPMTFSRGKDKYCIYCEGWFITLVGHFCRSSYTDDQKFRVMVKAIANGYRPERDLDE